MSTKIYRQGDVLIMRVEEVPPGTWVDAPREGGRIVLAHGEVTGHAHAIESKSATLRKRPGSAVNRGRAESQARALVEDALLIAKAPVVLRHEEHSPVHLPPGNYVVRIQREYAPGELRNVAD
jgi:hypothetical protein